MNREQVYGVIDTERAYQERDQKEKFWDHGGIPSVEAELLLVEEYVSKARTAWSNNPGNNEVLHVLRKIAGIIVRCGENHKLPPRQVEK